MQEPLVLFRFLFLYLDGNQVLLRFRNPTTTKAEGSFTLLGELPGLKTSTSISQQEPQDLLNILFDENKDLAGLPNTKTSFIHSLGNYVNPIFGNSDELPSTAYYLVLTTGCPSNEVAVSGNASSTQYSNKDPYYVWESPKNLIDGFYQRQFFLEPQVLHFLKALQNPALDVNDFIKNSLRISETVKVVGLQTRTEFAPHLLLIPFRSHTVPPLRTTTMVLIVAEDQCLLVDPGAGAVDDGLEHFEAVLSDTELLPSESTRKVSVFLTHHHIDHVEGLPLIASKFPHAQVYGHKMTLDRVETSLAKVYIEPGYEFDINGGQVVLSVEDGRGHTDGHMVLFQKEGRILIAGDHVVGFGSSSLDASCGDMKQYLATCTRLIDLQPHLAIPAHGAPNYDPVKLLSDYIKHRELRENEILNAIIKGGATDIDGILQIVYPTVPAPLVPHAKSNIILHLRKLKEEGKLPEGFSFPLMSSKV